MRLKTMKKTAQQGDVILKKVDSIPAGAKKLDHLILAEGEVTGHAHRITSGRASLWDAGGVMVLEAETPCTLTHEEHGPIVMSPGRYQVGRINEYDHFAEEARKVAD